MVKKLKCTHVQAFRLCTGRTAHKGSRGIALPFLDYGTRRGWGVSVMLRPVFTPGKDPGTHCTGGCVGPRPVLTGVENLAPIEFWSPDRPARGQSLYWLSYPTKIMVLLCHVYHTYHSNTEEFTGSTPELFLCNSFQLHYNKFTKDLAVKAFWLLPSICHIFFLCIPILVMYKQNVQLKMKHHRAEHIILQQVMMMFAFPDQR